VTGQKRLLRLFNQRLIGQLAAVNRTVVIASPDFLGRWFGEAGVIQRAVEPMLRAKLRERRLSCALEWMSSGQDKVARARGAQALVREGRVYVRDDGDGDCFVDECVAFPAGRYDDEVDCLSLIGRAVDRLTPPVEHWRPLPEYGDCGSVWEPGVNSGFGLPEFAEGGVCLSEGGRVPGADHSGYQDPAASCLDDRPDSRGSSGDVGDRFIVQARRRLKILVPRSF
jgi:hypothetical protein